MQKTTLNNGVEIPLLGFGTYLLKEGKECEQSVLEAIETGYRLIDTAAAYYNEQSVGNAIKTSGIKREEVFITTKLLPSDMSYEKAKRAFDVSLKKFGIDYLDLYLIHLPQGDINGAWKAMEELYHEGKIKAIGVSNFRLNQVQVLIKQHNIVPVVNQIETHPFSQKIMMQNSLKELGVQLEAWSPFAQGKNNLFKNEILKTIANKHQKSIAQIVLKWHVQRKIVAIPKSSSKERIRDNLNILNFELPAPDMEIIKSLDKGIGLIYHV